METNHLTAKFGLSLTPQDAELILEERSHALREQERVEFGVGVTPKIICEPSVLGIWTICRGHA